MGNKYDQPNPHSSEDYSNKNFSESEEDSIIIGDSEEGRSFINIQANALTRKITIELKVSHKTKKIFDWEKKRKKLLVKGKSTIYFKE